MKKLLLTIALCLSFVLPYAQEIPPPDETIPHDPETVWWGCMYSDFSPVYYYGYNRCYIEATEKQYVMWIKVSEGLKYHEVDCETEMPIGGWVSTL